MGVPGFFTWLNKNKNNDKRNKLILKNIDKRIDYLMLDTNCLLHPCVNYIIEKYYKGEIELNEKKSIREQIEILIWERIKKTIDEMINELEPKIIYIGIDGVAPMGKIIQQRQRRYKYLYDKKIKLQKVFKEIEYELMNNKNINKIPITSIELTPGTEYMERLDELFEKYVEELKEREIKCVYSSYHEIGEGEHKIMGYIKKEIEEKKTIIIYGLDADLLFLSLGMSEKYNLYVMREKQIFNNTEMDFNEKMDYNYVEINRMRKIIKEMKITIDDFILISYLIGNDFLPSLMTTNIKNGGLDKILNAY